MVALLMPATSPGEDSTSAVLKPRRSPQRRYMRKSMLAQSWASVPPEPAWMSRNALWESISPENMRRNSISATSCSMRSTSRTTSPKALSSPSSTKSSSNSPESSRPRESLSRVVTTSSRRARSRPSSWARSGLSQTLGFSSSRLTSWRRSRFESYSKIPPEGVGTPFEVDDLVSYRIDFHPRILLQLLCRLDVFDEQLKALLAAVFVHVRTVGDAHPGAIRRDVGTGLAEGDGVAALPAVRLLQHQLQVAVAHDAPVFEKELAIEQGFGKALAPGAGATQEFGTLQAQVLRRQFPVGV